MPCRAVNILVSFPFRLPIPLPSPRNIPKTRTVICTHYAMLNPYFAAQKSATTTFGVLQNLLHKVHTFLHYRSRANSNQAQSLTAESVPPVRCRNEAYQPQGLVRFLMDEGGGWGR